MSEASKYAVRIFWGWVLLNVVLSLVSLADGSLHESMLKAVDQLAAIDPAMAGDRDSMARSFAGIGAIYFLLTTALGAWLVHRAAAGRGSLLILGSAALWWAYESISSPTQLSQMSPGSVGWFDWAMGALGCVVWVAILVCAMRVPRGVARGTAS